MSRVYKILRKAEWDAALKAGVFAGSPKDLEDGFVHLSSAEQVAETARLHFHGQSDLVLLEFEAAALGAGLQWEPSRGGALFPHFHGRLTPGPVIAVHPLPLGPDGAPAPGPLRA